MSHQPGLVRWRAWVITSVVSALLLAACGGSTKAQGVSPTPHDETLPTQIIGVVNPGISHTFTPTQSVISQTGNRIVVIGAVACASTSCPAMATSVLSSNLRPEGWQTITLSHFGFNQKYGTVVTSYRFANRQDGFALFTQYRTKSIRAALYLTTDGGARWELIKTPHDQVLAGAFTTHSLVDLIGICRDLDGANACTSYALERRSLSSDRVTRTQLPLPTLPYPFLEQPSLSAQGSTVIVLANPTGPRTATPQLLESASNNAPIVDLARPSLGSVTACTLRLRTPAIWASCPTGMLVSQLRAKTLTSHFKRFWWPSGTSGDAFAPVNAQDAYRLVVNPQETGATLQLTTNGGASFVNVAPVLAPQFAVGGTTIAFRSLTHGFLTVSKFSHRQLRPVVWATIDAGAHWTQIFPLPTHV
ncbi:hypothetical protein [Ferrimicrobium sp.]|uniref:hypothetical protein n=1 Tax=Ferrimicrobium sp. TaxID=2926050 RepID=UPI002601C66E|nr:hypothetical protein [Ferrimicrobium sp.]